jgi:hypothetical protein
VVGERLEEIEVAAVDGRDLDRRTPQVRDRLEPSETATDDDDLVFSGARGAHGVHYFPRTSSVVWLPASAAASRGRLTSGPV